jgi:hypothetical protein
VVGKDPVELEKYVKKKFALPEEDISTNFVQYIAAFISTVTKYYSSYVAGPFLRKITKVLDFFYSEGKLFVKKLFYVIIFHNHLHHK